MSKRFDAWTLLSTQEKLALIDWAVARDKSILKSVPGLVDPGAVFDVTINGHSLGKFLNGRFGSENVRNAWLGVVTDMFESFMGGKIKEALAKTNAWIGIEDRIRELGQIGVDHLRSDMGPYARSVASQEQAKALALQTQIDRLPTEDGLEKWIADHHFISCCGIWWSSTPWNPMPAHHSAGATCLKCRKLVLRAKGNPNDLSAYQERLQETEPGSWIRFDANCMRPIAAGAIETFTAAVHMPHMVSHLGIPVSIASAVRIHRLTIGFCICIDGPVPGDLFAVRIPEDVKRPIDRGGSIGKPTLIVPGLPVTLQVHNKSCGPIIFEGALFGKPIESNQDSRGPWGRDPW